MAPTWPACAISRSAPPQIEALLERAVAAWARGEHDAAHGLLSQATDVALRGGYL